MSSPPLRRRPAVPAWRLLLPLNLLLWVAMPAAAQDPPVRDTVADVMAVDTLAGDTVPVRPLVRYPAVPAAASVGFAGGEWVWDREALLREAPTSLYDLLERVPGIAALRAGVLGQPETASAFGGTAGRVEVVVDGYVLDPLAATSLDLSRIPLAQLREVRVRRRLGLLRISLLTEFPDTEQPYTRVEAGIGEPSGNMFRGLFLVPHVAVGPLGLAIERLDTDGSGRNQPADLFSGWAKWSWTNGDRGVQFEWLRTTLKREPDSPWPVERVRQDMVVRARNTFAPGLVAELYAGRATMDETVPEPVDTVPDRHVDRESLQAGIRAVYQSDHAVIGGTLRYRDAASLPSTEAILDADVALGPARLTAEFGRASWPGSDATSFSSAHLEVGRFFGAAAFAEITRGGRGAPLYTDSVAAAVTDSRDGWRAGASLDLGDRATGSIAWVSLDQDLSRPFGLPFDSAAEPAFTSPATGIEAYGRLVLIRDFLAVESWITDWQEAAGWVYLPNRSWRTALTLHTSPLASGNLEILGRLDVAQRGAMLAFDPGADPEMPIRTLPSHTVASAYLQIRVIDVRAFIRWEDLLGANPESLPDRIQRGPRIFYGVKWDLWN